MEWSDIFIQNYNCFNVINKDTGSLMILIMWLIKFIDNICSSASCSSWNDIYKSSDTVMQFNYFKFRLF